MDQKKTGTKLEKTYRLLSLCARSEGHPTFYEQLMIQVSEFDAWDILPMQAELHGMAPLIWYHLKNSGLSIPVEIKQSLQGLYLRHRYLNQFHVESLIALINLLGVEGIFPVVLKGLPLAYTYYPDPALRPVSDIDLLFAPEEILPSLTLMKNAGYLVRIPQTENLPKTLHAESPLRSNLRTHIELHHYDPKMRTIRDNLPDSEFEGFLKPPKQVEIQGVKILTPDTMEHFYYLWRHLIIHFYDAVPEKPMLLKWVADIINFVEYHVDEIDWDALKKEKPGIINRLEVFYSFSPLPSKFQGIIPIQTISPPKGVYQCPKGWPRESLKKKKQEGFLRFLLDTFSTPTDWWLKVNYGIENRSLFFYGKVVFRLHVIYLLIRRFFQKLGI